MLTLNLDPDREVWLEEDDLELEDTPYAGHGIGFCVRLLKPDEMTRINNECFRMPRMKGRRRVRMDGDFQIDSTKMAAEKFVAMVTDWKGLADAEGQAITCTEEMRRAFTATQRELTAIVVQTAEDVLCVERQEALEEELGNSEGSGPGG